MVPRLSMLLCGCLMVGVFSGISGLADAADDFDRSGWLQNGQGLIEALQKVKQDKKPLVVYFMADWCGYCRQFEKGLLGTDQVKRYLSTGYAVMINPEKGAQENGIAQYYGVQGYPTFFVYGHGSGRLIRVDRHKMVNGRPQLLSPEEFVQAIKEAGKR